jgi:hypothetical protein
MRKGDISNLTAEKIQEVISNHLLNYHGGNSGGDLKSPPELSRRKFRR